MTTIIYKYQIPDPGRPLEAERASAPSGALVDFEPAPLVPAQVLERRIEELCPNVGTYGMGGPGFFGLRLDDEWLVIAIRGAAEWMTAKGRNVGDSFHDNYGRQRPWLADWLPESDADELSPQVVGHVIERIEVTSRSLKIVLDNQFDLSIKEGEGNRPLFEGTKEPRAFKKDDDLRRAIFLSPTTEIWV